MNRVALFVKEQFAWKKHGLYHDDREKFTKSQWPEFSGWIYPAYRVVLATYFFAWFIISIVEGGGIVPGAGGEIDDRRNSPPVTTPEPVMNTTNEISPITGIEYHPIWWWLVYLTNWTFTLFNLYLVYSAFSVTYYYFTERRKGHPGHNIGQVSQPQSTNKGLPLPLQIHWILFNLQVGLNPLVCVGFWTLIVPFDENLDQNLNVVSYHAHLLNGVVTIVDLFLVAIPLHLAHIYMTYFVGGAYIGASVMFWQASLGPYPIYGFLNYEKTPIMTSGILILVALLVLPLMQLGIYGLYRLRLRIWRKNYGSSWPRTFFLETPVQSSFKSMDSF